MSKHTPGPWQHSVRLSASENHRGFSIWTADGWALADVQPADEDGTEGEANARLIAAAPDLLEALKRMASIIDKMGDMPDGFIHPSPWQTLKCEEALEQARAAIAKAEEA